MKTTFTEDLFNNYKSFFNFIKVDENGKIDLTDFIMFKIREFFNQKIQKENEKIYIPYDVNLGLNNLKFNFNQSVFYIDDSFNVKKNFITPKNQKKLKNKLENKIRK